jgi:hypothetical protein
MFRLIAMFGRLCTVLLLLPLLGCGSDTSQPDYASLGLVQISGTVTLDGQPLPGAAVYFHDRPNRRYSYGVTDSAGRYKLMLDSRMAGILPGPKEVEITTLKNPAASPLDTAEGSGSEGGDEAEQSDEEGGVVAGQKELVPSKYNSPTTLTYEVTSSNSAVDFDLTSR